MQRISGQDVEARLSNGLRMLFDSASLNLEDGITATSDQGYPSGWVFGEVKGDGEVEVSTDTLELVRAEADAAGSWAQMPEFDLTFFTQVGSLELKVEVFGIKLRFPSFEFDGKGGDKLMHKIPFVIGSPDFVKLNGTPLARRR